MSFAEEASAPANVAAAPDPDPDPAAPMVSLRASRDQPRSLLQGLRRLLLSDAADSVRVHPAYHDVTIVCRDGQVQWNR